MRLTVPSESPDCAASSDIRMTQLSVTGGNTMSDTIMMTHYDKKAVARAKALYKAREALKSVVGAIQGAGDLDKLSAGELRLIVGIVRGTASHAKNQLKGISNVEEV